MDDSCFEAGEAASRDGASALARLDELAAAFIRRAAPVRFALAGSEAERTAVFRLRHRIVVERGWADPGALVGGIERDEWDEVAVLVGGWDGDTLVACARIVFPAPGRPLPAEAVFGLTIPPVGRVAHVDRLAVARGACDGSHRVLLGLIGHCWQETRARGCDVWAGIDSRLTTRLYRAIGFDVRVLGPGRRYWNEERFPVCLDVAAGAEAIVARWGALFGPPASEEAAAPPTLGLVGGRP